MLMGINIADFGDQGNSFPLSLPRIHLVARGRQSTRIPVMSTLTLTFPFIRFSTGLGQMAAVVAARWRHARRLRETRRYLAQMDDHMLQDLGVSRAQAAFELDHAGSRRSHR
jgi:uncharacterized protein YjiS (DUF1127 family)